MEVVPLYPILCTCPNLNLCQTAWAVFHPGMNHIMHLLGVSWLFACDDVKFYYVMELEDMLLAVQPIERLELQAG
jgi:hypothetical protein